MGTQNQPGGQTDDKQRDPNMKQPPKAKEAGNVPRSDDDVADESSQGTREDATGSNVQNN